MQTVKMVVTGPFSSGKTQFIGSVSEIDVVATERKITGKGEREVKDATTVAMDFGRITVDEDLVLYLFHDDEIFIIAKQLKPVLNGYLCNEAIVRVPYRDTFLPAFHV